MCYNSHELIDWGIVMSKSDKKILYLQQLRQNISDFKFATGVNFRDFIHGPLLKVMKSIRNYNLSVEGRVNYINNKPVIFAVNHSNVHDVPTVSEVIGDHYYLLAGDEVKNDFNGFLFNCNGVVWVDRSDKKSTAQSKQELIKLLKHGINVLIFIEGTWNRTESNLMLPCKWGVVQISKETGCPIIPIALEYPIREYPNCYANIGMPISFNQHDDLFESITKLRDEIATLRWLIWEKLYSEDHDRISVEEFNDFVDMTLKEYPKLDTDFEDSVIFKPFDSQDEVFKHIKKLNYNRNNAFLLKGSKMHF